MLSIRLEPEIEQRLAQLSQKTGRSRSYYARQAILEYLEDMEDYYLATEALQDKDEKTWTLEQLERNADNT